MNSAIIAGDLPGHEFHGNQYTEGKSIAWSYKGKSIDIKIHKSSKGYAAIINGKPLMQFENPLEPYWFSSESAAEQGAKQHYQRGLSAGNESTYSDPIECRAAVEISPTATNEILFLPIGLHGITPVHGGIGREIKVLIDGDSAASVEAQRAALVNKGKRPYFDFNHEDGPASFWPESFAWRTGDGVIARGEWTARGRNAVEGKDYRAFSPVFHVDNKRSEAARVICKETADPNMGGLVNNPAFKNLPLWAKNAEQLGNAGVHGENAATNGETIMTNEELAALRAKHQELEQKVAALEAEAEQHAEDETLKAKRGEGVAELRAMQLEIQAAEMQTRTEVLEAQVRARNKKDAEAEVKAAVQRQAILPKDFKTQTELIARATADPSFKDVIRAMQGPGKDTLSTRIIGHHVTVTEDEPRAIFGALARIHSQSLQSKTVAERRDLSREFAAIYTRELSIKASNAERTLAFPMWQMDQAIEAADVTDTNLGTLSGTLVTQRTLELLKFRFPDLTRFTTDFSDQAAAFNQTIMTRTIDISAATDYNTTTGWADSTHVTHDVPVTINKHKGVAITFNEQTLASTVRRLFDESAEAAAYALGKALVDDLYSKITDANFAHNRVVATASFNRSTVVDINTDLDLLGVPMGANMRTLLLYPTVFGQLQKDTSIVSLGFTQQAQLITAAPLDERSNYMINVGGFNVISAPNLPTNNANLTGFAGSKSALCIVTRMPNDYTTWGTGVSNGNVQMVTEPDIGMSVMLTQYVNHQLAIGTQRFSLMFGTAAGQAAAGELVKAAAGSGSSRVS